MRAAIAILMTCALMLAPASAIAEEHADEGPYEVTVSDERAEIGTQQPVAERTGETGVVFDTKEGLLSGSFGFSDANASEERLDVRLHQLVEFRDENDNGHLDDEDRVASAWKLSNASRNATAESNGTVEWRALETTNVTSDDGVEGTRVHGVAEFPQQDPLAGVIDQLGQGENRTVTLNLTVYEEAAEVDNRTVPASHVHVDWTVANFPYTSDDTQLALVAGSTSTSELAVRPSAAGTELVNQGTLDGFGVEVAANVSDRADVDGNGTSVEAAELADEDGEDEKLVGLGYERGDAISHGLVLGASATATDESVVDAASDDITAVPSLGTVAALGLLAGAALIVKRR